MNATAPKLRTVQCDPDALFSAAFNVPRDPRSQEYKAGALALLRFKCGKADSLDCPHPPGTAAADAWFSGLSEGHAILRQSLPPA